MTIDVPAHLDALETLGDLSRFHARERPGMEALNCEGRSTSYVELDRLTSQVANGLLAEGLTAGSRVGFMDKNSDDFYQLVLGCAKAGCVSVGINWRLAPPEVAYILNDSRTEVLFVGPDFFGLVERIQHQVPSLRRIVAMVPGHEAWTAFADWRDGQDPADPAVPVSTDDVAIQMYTSGTTGHPKGVQLPHRCFFDLW
jgi:acyl-CoA synthetase (AMP-forming)/AMP-acid ligase II